MYSIPSHGPGLQRTVLDECGVDSTDGLFEEAAFVVSADED